MAQKTAAFRHRHADDTRAGGASLPLSHDGEVVFRDACKMGRRHRVEATQLAINAQIAYSISAPPEI
jgi:hypothetical protein